MKLGPFKYLIALTAAAAGLFSLTQQGWLTWFAPIYAFVIIPLLELFSPASKENMTEVEEAVAKENPWYDYMVYAFVPMQWATLVYFLFTIGDPSLQTYEIVGRVFSMGIGCGVFGINAAHELGHRVKPHEQFMAKVLLLSSLYMHFIIEHNRGHHKNVSTPDDPASARYGESLYAFWVRSVVGSYISAWKIENNLRLKKNLPVWALGNEMVQFTLIQLGLLVAIALVFSPVVMLYFIAAATIGFLLLETVNYIEHYGLLRKKTGETSYERVLPIHSWNSNHALGRLLLFELSRHSDHHYLASRKYQVLRHFDDAPQMPTGYPGMMVLSTIPPLWFYVMHRKIAQMKAQGVQGLAVA